MTILAKEKVRNTPFPPLVVNNESREFTAQQSHRFRGSVRIATSQFMTNKEAEDFILEASRTEMP